MSVILWAEDTTAAVGTAVQMFPPLLLHKRNMGGQANIT